MINNPSEHDDESIYRLMIGSVVPGHMAFVSFLRSDGVRNLLSRPRIS